MERFIIKTVMPMEVTFEVDGRDMEDAVNRLTEYGDYNDWLPTGVEWINDNLADIEVISVKPEE